MHLNIEIPDFLPKTSAAEVLASHIADLFRKGAISRGHVRKAMGFDDYWSTMDFLASKGAIEFSKEMIEQDLEYVKSKL